MNRTHGKILFVGLDAGVSLAGAASTVDEPMTPFNAKCYTRSALTDLGGLWGKLMLARGSGGNNPECKKP